MGFDKKLLFLSDAGFFNSRTIRRFGTLRNKIEHEFKRPKIDDLEAYYDLVTALVAILQNGMTPGFSETIELSVYDEAWKNEIGFFYMSYKSETRCFYARWGTFRVAEDNSEIFASLDSPEDFAYFFRVLVLLNQRESLASREHIERKLQT